MAFGLTGTGAWFTSAREINNNSISTGTIDLGVEGGPFTVQNLQPGADWRDVGWFCAANNGNYDMKWRGWIHDVNDPKDLRDFLHIRITMNPADHPGSYGPANTVLAEDVAFNDLLSNSNTILLLDESTISSGDPAFSPGASACYQIEAKLASDAGDAQQNSVLSGKLYLLGTQWIAPW